MNDKVDKVTQATAYAASTGPVKVIRRKLAHGKKLASFKKRLALIEGMGSVLEMWPTKVGHVKVKRRTFQVRRVSLSAKAWDQTAHALSSAILGYAENNKALVEKAPNDVTQAVQKLKPHSKTYGVLGLQQDTKELRAQAIRLLAELSDDIETENIMNRNLLSVERNPHAKKE